MIDADRKHWLLITWYGLERILADLRVLRHTRENMRRAIFGAAGKSH